MHMARVILKKNREKSLRQHHPWIFSGAVARAPEGAGAGETVLVQSGAGEPLAVGAWSPASQISVRVWSFDPAEAVDADFFRSRIAAALSWRRLTEPGTGSNAARLVHAESDALPGLIVDRYDDFLCCQFLSAGAERWREEIVGVLVDLLHPRGIYERSDTDARGKEGLAPRAGVMHGAEPPDSITLRFGPIRLGADLRAGHKTGLYLDQQAHVSLVRGWARDREVLNCFSYTGAFGVAALAGGAREVINVDSSAGALDQVPRNLEMNGIAVDRSTQVVADVATELRRLRDKGREFDMVILDPPKFVANANQLTRGARAYKDINLLGMKLLRHEGILITFSCSGHMGADLFQKVVADAALDANRQLHIIEFLSQPPDHAVAAAFPQGRYLKGLVCIVN
jgi:23S rRNA (cytosine1962-C5)-methyltransferase